MNKKVTDKTEVLSLDELLEKKQRHLICKL